MRLSRSIPAVAVLAMLAACDLSTEPNIPAPIDPAQDTYATSLGVNIASMTKTASGLYYKDKTVGTGDVVAAVNDSIRANYTLWLTNGTKVDSSIDSGTPIEFRIGDTDVIPGFSEGFVGMKPGGVRQLVIPTQLAWGSRGSAVPGKISVQPNANVVFEIEYLSKF
jgi:FKBP-type peptidyl-prolyl cis-trans isomerase FkpA